MKSEQFETIVNSKHEDCEVIFGYQTSAQIGLLAEKSSNILFHYNIARHLRSHFCSGNTARLSRILPATLRSAVTPRAGKTYRVDFHADLNKRRGAWSALQRLDHTKRAIILVADRATLLERVEGRQFAEPLWNDETSQYNRTLWRKIYEQVDLLALYQGWCDFLEARNIPYCLVYGMTTDFPPIDNRERLSALLA